jgi:hypothetical protein
MPLNNLIYAADAGARGKVITKYTIVSSANP